MATAPDLTDVQPLGFFTERLADADSKVADAIKAFQHRTNKGIDPLYVGELVREAIENDWPYIFTDTEHEPIIERRFATIKQGFDRIRGRTPRR